MVYVTGDLHGDYSRLKSPAIRKLRAGDVLLVCGDFWLYLGQFQTRTSSVEKAE